MNRQWMRAGFGYLSLGATSRVILKYGSWSMAHGMRQWTSVRSPKMCGKAHANEGAACTAGNDHFPMQSDDANPKIDSAVVAVTILAMRRIVGYMCLN